MSIAIGIALILVLGAVTAGLVPLLLQLRNTARGLDQFLRAAQMDLAQIAQDVHAARLRTDELAASIRPTLDELGSIARTVDEAGKTALALKDQYIHCFDTVSQTLGSLLGGFASLRAFLRHE
jgi:xanthine/uracil/vitamin C permease (AzgA family)